MKNIFKIFIVFAILLTINSYGQTRKKELSYNNKIDIRIKQLKILYDIRWLDDELIDCHEYVYSKDSLYYWNVNCDREKVVDSSTIKYGNGWISHKMKYKNNRMDSLYKERERMLNKLDSLFEILP